MAARTGLKVFYDSFSQPSRAVLLLLNVNSVKYEPRMIKIGKRKQLFCCLCTCDKMFSLHSVEQKTNEEFMRVNPHKKVPAIEDNGFALSER